MSKNHEVSSNKLNNAQINILNTILNLFIPPDRFHEIPGATEVDFLKYIHQESLNF